ncbi:hypothetical protein N9E48_03060 [Paracoccaceae bacterium]|nr:hypothetical protein [Paracoccaceae bacterium]
MAENDKLENASIKERPIHWAHLVLVHPNSRQIVMGYLIGDPGAPNRDWRRNPITQSPNDGYIDSDYNNIRCPCTTGV